jgi:phenylacetic acid degradation operon negative regulatory protein
MECRPVNARSTQSRFRADPGTVFHSAWRRSLATEDIAKVSVAQTERQKNRRSPSEPDAPVRDPNRRNLLQCPGVVIRLHDMIGSYDRILSYIEASPASELIYSLFSAYGRRRGDEIPGTWFVAALGLLRHQAAAVRQALLRMVRSGALEARHEGRMTWYWLSRFGQAAIAAGSSKMLEPPEPGWDGLWTIVLFEFDNKSRPVRDHVREMLELEGFASLRRGVYVHPRDRTNRLRELIGAPGQDERVMVFRGSRLSGEDDAALAARLWDLRQLKDGYRRFIDLFRPFLKSRQVPIPARAFAIRLGLALKYLENAWHDPDLPRSLLPADWSGLEARSLAQDLYNRLLRGTLEHGDDIALKIGVLDRFKRPSANSNQPIPDVSLP